MKFKKKQITSQENHKFPKLAKVQIKHVRGGKDHGDPSGIPGDQLRAM